MEFTADQVWGCAAAAHRINEGYIKDDVWNYNTPAAFIAKKANKALVKQWLREQDFGEITEEDYAAGRSYRDHFKTYTLQAMAGQLNDFQMMALKIASTDAFTGRNMLEFAIVACLPSVAERDRDRTALKKEVYSSQQLTGEPGDPVRGVIRVINSSYSKTYNKNRVTAAMGDSFVDFWANFEVAVGDEFPITAKIKTQRDNKTTQLNFVKKAK